MRLIKKNIHFSFYSLIYIAITLISFFQGESIDPYSSVSSTIALFVTFVYPFLIFNIAKNIHHEYLREEAIDFLRIYPISISRCALESIVYLTIFTSLVSVSCLYGYNLFVEISLHQELIYTLQWFIQFLVIMIVNSFLMIIITASIIKIFKGNLISNIFVIVLLLANMILYKYIPLLRFTNGESFLSKYLLFMALFSIIATGFFFKKYK